MRFTRRRSDRPDPARRRLRSSLETLEKREVLSTSGVNYYAPQVAGVIQGSQSASTPTENIANLTELSTNYVLAQGTEGKELSGTDRLGNQWQIIVHGPGEVIVTDTTPNDGVFDDSLDTIQLVGTSPTSTYVTGGVSATTQSQTADSGIVFFNKLISQNGVKSIVLNGFVLDQDITAIPNGGLPYSDTGIYLPKGAGTLAFTGIDGVFDLSTSPDPINIIIGDPNVPLKIKPNIRIDEIQNTVYDSTSTVVPTTPNTTPSINIIVNGKIGQLNLVSATQATFDAGDQYYFPIVGTTGRTSVQATAVGSMNVTGSAINVTVSRTATPFQGAFSAVDSIGKATFGGTPDALALDVSGKIGGLRFANGLGNPTSNSNLPANYGIPYASTGFAGNGYSGGTITASSIGHVNAGTASTTLLTSNNPADQQSSPGTPLYFPVPGASLTNASITTTGSIGSVKIAGDLTGSEIKTGFNLESYAAGFSGQTGRSLISDVKINGNLFNSVISASYTPGPNGYGTDGSSAGPGTITGNVKGAVYSNGSPTILGNTGSGVYAKHKKGYLPAN